MVNEGKPETHLSGLAVVRLRLSEPSRLAPVPGVPLGGRSDLHPGAGPEPPVDVGRLQVGPVAAREVALPTRSPDVPHVAPRYPLLDELVLLGRLQGYGVHAVPPADVARVQPVDLEAAGGRVLPAEEVRVGDAAGVPVVGVADTWGMRKLRLLGERYSQSYMVKINCLMN